LGCKYNLIMENSPILKRIFKTKKQTEINS